MEDNIIKGSAAQQMYDKVKAEGRLIYEVMVGSHSYGLNVESSDEDFKFIYIDSLDDVLSGNATTQINVTDDYVGYEIGRYLELLRKQNPNIIEILYTDNRFIKYCHPLFSENIIANRDLFLSNKVAFSFGEYATTQIKKAQGTNKKFMNPMDKERKTLLDFCWVGQGQGSIPLRSLIGDYPQWMFGCVAVDHMKNCYHLFSDTPSKMKFFETEDETIRDHIYAHRKYNGIEDKDGVQIKLSSTDKNDVPVCLFYCNIEGFSKYCKDYLEYWNWVEDRNVARFVENSEPGRNYDCYVDSETEYLTENGWKKYDDILDNELLQTIDESGNKVLSPIIDRIKKDYSGNIFSYKNAYTKFSVTPNHNLFLSKSSRGKNKNYSVIRQMNNPEFISVEKYFEKKNSYYCFYNSINENNMDLQNIEDDYIQLMGLFLSDGTIGFLNDQPNALIIGQSEGGKICEYIKNIKYPYKEYSHTRINKTKEEFVYHFDKNIAIKIYNDCGHGSHKKTLPSWVNLLSKRQLNLLIEYIFHGDGFISKNGYKVYYTVSKELANNLQIACLNNGITTKIMGPYTNVTTWGKVTLYHLYFPVQEFNINYLNKKKSNIKSKSGWIKKEVSNIKISCFTTSSNILITRNENLIAIQGNTKNMMHCHRLLDMAIEILSGEGVNVFRKNREELLNIRNGKATYQELVDKANIKKESLDSLYKLTTLPDLCDKSMMDLHLKNLRKAFYNI